MLSLSNHHLLKMYKFKMCQTSNIKTKHACTIFLTLDIVTKSQGIFYTVNYSKIYNTVC